MGFRDELKEIKNQQTNKSMSKKESKLADYIITDDPALLEELHPIPKELSGEIEHLYELVIERVKSSEIKFLQLIEKYPGSPILKNYLSILYKNIGKFEKAKEVTNWLVKEHPGYLFGRLNKAIEYLENKEYEKIPGLMGEHMEIRELYPDREVFHVSEIKAFLGFTIMYYAAIEDIEQAEMRLAELKKVAPENTDIVELEELVLYARTKKYLETWEEEEKTKKKVHVKQTVIPAHQGVKPVFNHPEVEELYKHDLLIEQEIIENLLALPKDTLRKDLETILMDSIHRYAFFNQKIEDEENEEEMNFVIHAFSLLGEIEAKESLDVIFEIFRQDEYFLDFYLGDFLSSVLWQPLYKIANNQLEACKKFMQEPGIYTYTKTTISKVAEQIIWHQPKRRSEVIAWYEDILNFYLGSTGEDNVIDSDLISLIIYDLIGVKATELIDVIKNLYDKGMVTKSICGEYDEVERDMPKGTKIHMKEELLSIKETYDEITAPWTDYDEDEFEDDYDDYEDYDEDSLPMFYNNEKIEPVRTGEKIGRNDPCPCGSGKKYKKCCQ